MTADHVSRLGAFPCLVAGEGPPLVFLAGLLPTTGTASLQRLHTEAVAPSGAIRGTFRVDMPANVPRMA